MAALFDDKPLVAGINEDWDEQTTGRQIMRPEWDFSPIRMKTMHHLPQILFDTLHPERPDCPVLIPSSFTRSRDRVISQDIYIVMNHGIYRQETSHASRAGTDTLDDSEPNHTARMHSSTRSSDARTGIFQRS